MNVEGGVIFEARSWRREDESAEEEGEERGESKAVCAVLFSQNWG